MMLQDPKAIIDTMLGAIALTVGKETLDTYSTTMSSRGQTARRVSDVTRALSPLSESMKAIPGGFSGMDFSAHRSSRRR
jgi:hypothetical protein